MTAKNVWRLPVSGKWHSPPITPDANNPGHYQTFIQSKEASAFSDPDQHLSVAKHGKGTKCQYVFTSTSDSERHTLLVHGGKRGMPDDESTKKNPEQLCKVCDCVFKTRFQLQKHQKDTGHKLKKGRPSSK